MQQLNVLLKLAQLREQQASKQYQQAEQQVTQARDCCNQLQQYAQEYQQNLQNTGESGISGMLLKQYGHFSTQIDYTLTEQQKSLVSLKHDSHLCQKTFQAQRQHTLAMQTLVQKCEAEITQQQLKQEQKQNDEFGQRCRGTPYP